MKIVAPQIVAGMPAEDYHQHPSISKTGLWTIYTKTPAHFARGQRVEKTHFAFGNAAHTAITEPEEFAARFMFGPEDRRGNKWKDAELAAAAGGLTPLTAGEFENCLRLRDVAAEHPILRQVAGQQTLIEASAFWHDPKTNVLCRCRPDIIVPSMGLCVDLKTTTDASPAAFAKSVWEYGYHVQEAYYTDGWKAANNLTSSHFDAWLFVAIEKTEPYEIGVFELEPEVVEEGRAIYRKALDTYSDCLFRDEWPGHPRTVQPLGFKPWQYRETQPIRLEASHG